MYYLFKSKVDKRTTNYVTYLVMKSSENHQPQIFRNSFFLHGNILIRGTKERRFFS